MSKSAETVLPPSLTDDSTQPLQGLDRYSSYYWQWVLRSPIISVLVLAALILGIFRFIPDFQLDASADSLVLEGDQALAYYRESKKDFPSSDDFLVIAVTPNAPLFSLETVNQLKALKSDLSQIQGVQSIHSILNVPLLNSPEMTLSTVSDHLETLEGGYDDWEAAKKAFLTNPFYRNLLVSDQNEQTTAMQIVLDSNPRHAKALQQRNQLRDQVRQGNADATQKEQLAKLEKEVKVLNQEATDNHKRLVSEVRQVVSQHQGMGELFLGGIPMIVVDMLDYVRSDVKVFGLGVVGFLVLMLGVIFRRPLCVVLPIFCALVTCLVMVGYLGMVRFPVTVISSNFVSLLLIITMSMIIHLVVRYRELASLQPHWSQKFLVLETVRQMARPCLYTSLTTVVAFISLVVSNIRPVIDFGIMMTIGIGFAYATAFLLFPVLLALFPRSWFLVGSQKKEAIAPSDSKDVQEPQCFSTRFAKITDVLGGGLIGIAILMAILSMVGISRLSVENRFIDYFKSHTEIYQGMKTIDEKLGGTTPLDIIIDIPLDVGENLDEEDCFLDDECMDDVYGESTVFTQGRIDQFRKIHQWLEDLPETGKVLSLVSTIDLAKQIKGDSLDALELAFLNAMFPDDLRGLLLDPYVNESTGKVRFTLRIIESDPNLKRQALLDKTQDFLVNDIGLNPSEVHFTSMVVLYNNMLQSLFKSQIATIGVVFGCIMLMFLVLFRSLYLAGIGILPNMLAAGVVMGMMGFLNISLDMMTITIAAISVGIAVDNTIHYLYRFKAEFAKVGHYKTAMYRSHATIGSAMYYTSITIIFGFSILAMSNFYPTIYFGLFTGLAMLIALFASLTLLPELIVMLKPFGPELNTIEPAPLMEKELEQEGAAS